MGKLRVMWACAGPFGDCIRQYRVNPKPYPQCQIKALMPSRNAKLLSCDSAAIRRGDLQRLYHLVAG